MNVNDKVTFRFKGQLYLATVEVKQAVFAAGKAAELAAAAKVPKDAQVDPSFVEVRRAAIQPILDAALAAKTAEPVFHKFEKAGLGLAPFHCVGMSESVYQPHPDCPKLPGSTCDYCGNAIMSVFHIRSRDGKNFKVGCDCVMKTEDRGLIREIKSRPEVLAKAREARARKASAVQIELEALIKKHAEQLRLQPHSKGFTDRQTGAPLTRLDEVKWLYNQCGAAGRDRLLKNLKKNGLV